MKAGAIGVLSHDPGVSIANFFDWRSSQSDNLRIPTRGVCIAALHAFAKLHKGVLYVAGVLLIVEVFAELLVRELAAEPGIPPEEKRHEHDEPGDEEKKKTIACRHATGARRGRSRVAGW